MTLINNIVTEVHIGLTLKLNMTIIYVATLSNQRLFVPRKNILLLSINISARI